MSQPCFTNSAPIFLTSRTRPSGPETTMQIVSFCEGAEGSELDKSGWCKDSGQCSIRAEHEDLDCSPGSTDVTQFQISLFMSGLPPSGPGALVSNVRVVKLDTSS